MRVACQPRSPAGLACLPGDRSLQPTTERLARWRAPLLLANHSSVTRVVSRPLAAEAICLPAPRYPRRPPTGCTPGSARGGPSRGKTSAGQPVEDVDGDDPGQSAVVQDEDRWRSGRTVQDLRARGTRLEAWARTAEGCIREAVHAVVEGFADTSGARPVGERTCAVTADSDEDLLVSVLEEAIYRTDVDGEIPLDTEVDVIRDSRDGRAVSVRFTMADADTAEQIGAVPKAVSLHGLDLTGGPGGWTCQVTLDA
ncbi:archease [Kitasatospora sp. NPDC059648]|uniref:archease n=1 Tax=Kitasatospora sp. NPDC059648 TaxID=3346894 RepID=UPI00369E3C0C